MSGHLTTNDGGAARATTGEVSGAAVLPQGSETDLMHQHGGAAPNAASTSGAQQPLADAMAGGMPAEGGFVRGR